MTTWSTSVSFREVSREPVAEFDVRSVMGDLAEVERLGDAGYHDDPEAEPVLACK